ncbi:5-oxoprolinase subunit C family protein [Alteribacillus iranensis]|uniref:Biotin-dependent carboxylase uncharacterized domain-containing protein n=1 Tax=Alteribacillus iranensis TaxID=930128 RepID=A0A1I2EC07_9BACI|nr:biotin-dependent carboxyltransferase family protein [Alteribacillus iranensis]SFE90554.1 biotin-dependent carboxylase uncharacterized domain-containing protein [Alteribacillus iranensis]
MEINTLCSVEKPGMFTTIQDAGRIGYQSKGIPTSGVMDAYAFKCANVLVKNEGTEAVLEMTLTGPVLHFHRNALIALTGADMKPKLNGVQRRMWKSFYVKKGDTLTFRGAAKGARTYMAVHGGVYADEILNSKSTYVKAMIGGLKGRALQKGDLLFREEKKEERPTPIALHPSLIPSYSDHVNIRVITGPEAQHFTKESLDRFFTSSFQVTNQADRMGIRLQGPMLRHTNGADIISDAVSFGTIQVAADGQPMILMADRQTTGGYTRIAHVITTDLSKVAQLLPSQTLCFQKVDIQKAHQEILEEKKLFKQMRFARLCQ